MPSKVELELVDPVLYISEDTAKDLALRPEDIVNPSQVGNYVFVPNKEAVSDIRYLQEEYKRVKRGTRQETDRPIVGVGSDGRTPTLLIADNETEAEEVQAILGETFEKQEKALRTQQRNPGNKTPVIDTEWVRYINDLPPSELFDRFFRQALEDRVEKHKKNPITDPSRNPWDEAREKGLLPDPLVTAVPENYSVKEETNATNTHNN